MLRHLPDRFVLQFDKVLEPGVQDQGCREAKGVKCLNVIQRMSVCDSSHGVLLQSLGWEDVGRQCSCQELATGKFQVTVCGIAVCPFSRHRGNQRPKRLQKKAQMYLSRNCPFSDKTNLHLELPGASAAELHTMGKDA